MVDEQLLQRATRAYADALAIADPIRLQFWREHGLTMQEVRVAFNLLRRSDQTAGELAESMKIAASSATRLCDRLVAQGLIARREDTEDRRCVRLRLTEEGRRIVCELESAGRFYLSPVLESLGEERLRRLAECLEELARAAQHVGATGEGT